MTEPSVPAKRPEAKEAPSLAGSPTGEGNSPKVDIRPLNGPKEPVLPVVPPEWDGAADELWQAPSPWRVSAILLLFALIIAAFVRGRSSRPTAEFTCWRDGKLSSSTSPRPMRKVSSGSATGWRRRNGRRERALELFLAGPQTEGFVSTIPAGTSVRQLQVAGGIARVDFSRELQEGHPGRECRRAA